MFPPADEIFSALHLTPLSKVKVVIIAQDRPIVYLLWGRPAQSKMPMLTNPKHKVLTAPHPSPLSASRGFFGCRHFSQTNAFLEANGIEPVDWQIEDV